MQVERIASKVDAIKVAGGFDSFIRTKGEARPLCVGAIAVHVAYHEAWQEMEHRSAAFIASCSANEVSLTAQLAPQA